MSWLQLTYAMPGCYALSDVHTHSGQLSSLSKGLFCALQSGVTIYPRTAGGILFMFAGAFYSMAFIHPWLLPSESLGPPHVCKLLRAQLLGQQDSACRPQSCQSGRCKLDCGLLGCRYLFAL